MCFTELAPVFAAAIAGYFLGAVPFAVIVARRYGVDIMKEGSGNPGATNVKRVIGKGPGNLVFALDVLKGAIASGAPMLAVLIWGLTQENAGVAEVGLAGETCPLSVSGWLAQWAASPLQLAFAQLAGFLGAVLGHCFSVFLRFRGGKGVAVSAGGLLGAMPLCLGVSTLIWLIVYKLSRYVFLASLVAGLALPVTAWIYFGGTSAPQFWVCVAIAVFLFWTHRQNIRRFLNGTENRFTKKPTDTAPADTANDSSAKNSANSADKNDARNDVSK